MTASNLKIALMQAKRAEWTACNKTLGKLMEQEDNGISAYEDLDGRTRIHRAWVLANLAQAARESHQQVIARWYRQDAALVVTAIEALISGDDTLVNEAMDELTEEMRVA